MRLSRDREIEKTALAAIKIGWTLSIGGKHLQLLSPRGKYKMPIPGSPGDRRTALNFRAQLRRYTEWEKA